MTIEEEVAKAHELCDEMNLDQHTTEAMQKAADAGIGPSTFVFVMLEWVACICAYLNTRDGEDSIDKLVNVFRTVLISAFKEKRNGL